MTRTSAWLLGCSAWLGCSGTAPHTDAVAETQDAGSHHAGAGGRGGSAGGGGSAGEAGRRALPPAAVSGGSRAPAAVGGSGGNGGARAMPPAMPADDADAGPSAVGLERPAPDPNITFTWKETEPGVAKPCDAGTYVGDFICDLPLDDGSGTVHIEGPVQLMLSKSQNGEFLEIADGKIEGYALLVLNFRAGLHGKLECSTRMLEAMPVDGMVGLGDAALLPVFGFSGDLTGTLNDTGDAIMGTWSFPVTTQNGVLGTCTGPWSATRMAP